MPGKPEKESFVVILNEKYASTKKISFLTNIKVYYKQKNRKCDAIMC